MAQQLKWHLRIQNIISCVLYRVDCYLSIDFCVFECVSFSFPPVGWTTMGILFQSAQPFTHECAFLGYSIYVYVIWEQWFTFKRRKKNQLIYTYLKTWIREYTEQLSHWHGWSYHRTYIILNAKNWWKENKNHFEYTRDCKISIILR